MSSKTLVTLQHSVSVFLGDVHRNETAITMF